MSGPVVILGLGFTTRRLARRLVQQGTSVVALVRNAGRFADLARFGIELRGLSSDSVPRSATLIHTIPPLPEAEKSAIRSLIRQIEPRRILYISSTGVYGAQDRIDAATATAPNEEKGRARVDEEQWIADTSGSSLILRSAAIYGPGRGVHVRLREGKMPRGAGGVVSRIHVDDLVSHLEVGIESAATGAWPVADECPAPAEEVVGWCAKFMGISMPDSSAPGFPVAGRSVDGTKIRELLGIRLKYASYESGIPASLADEKQGVNQ